MKNEEKILKSNDGNCPYCGSWKTFKAGSIGARPSSSSKFPDAGLDVWICDDCKKRFKK